MPIPTVRQTFFLIAIAALILTASAYYLQHVEGLNPCYLCITQRVFVMLFGAIALIGALHNPGPTGIRVYAVLCDLAALGGAFFAGKQLWLQSLPEDQVPACGLPADVVFDYLETSEALAMFFKGDGNCAEVQWTLLGISIPGWAMVGFVVVAALSTWQFVRAGQVKK